MLNIFILVKIRLKPNIYAERFRNNYFITTYFLFSLILTLYFSR